MLIASALASWMSLGLPANWQFIALPSQAPNQHWQITATPELVATELHSALRKVVCEQTQQQDAVWFCSRNGEIWSVVQVEKAWILSRLSPSANASVRILGIAGAEVFNYQQAPFSMPGILIEAPVARVLKNLQLRYAHQLKRQLMLPEVAEVKGVHLVLGAPERYLHLQAVENYTLLMVWQVQS